MPKFKLAKSCQNKESKQNKHDKRDKGNASECLFNTSFCFETWQNLLKGRFSSGLEGASAIT